MKTTTQKQLAATQKAFKPILTYLEQQQKLAAALKALADKKTTFETERQTIIRQAGTIEAQSLLGDSTPEGEQTVAVNLSALRERQERLQAAEEALHQQRAELEQQLPAQLESLTALLYELSETYRTELEDEWRQTVAHLNTIMFRLYAVQTTIGTATGYTRSLFEIQIPSLLDTSANLFRRPIDTHALRNDIVAKEWKADSAAVHLAEQLKLFGDSKYKLEQLERETKWRAAS
ncbi:MAG: hypothetical protein ACK48P_00395 [Holosporales bacterium]|jgi:hypothetical protein